MRRLSAALAAGAATLAGAAAPPAAQALPRISVDGPRVVPEARKAPARLTAPGFRGRVGIEVRGQSSARFPKRSYALELRDARGRDRKARLLGLPADADWVLHAGYNDKTLLRNALVTATARALGRYASRARWVELVRNGRSEGVHLLMERPELGGDRVRGGGALLELTSPAQAASKAPTFSTPVTRLPLAWQDPDRDDLSPRRAAQIRTAVAALDRTLAGRAPFPGPLDVGAAVDFVLLQELVKNPDGFHASTYLRVARDGTIELGPPWDFDTALGNNGWAGFAGPEGWVLAARPWPAALRRVPAFEARLRARWAEIRRGGLLEAMLAEIDRGEALLRVPAARNFRRWPVLDTPVWPNPLARGSHGAEVQALRGWLRARVAWMDAALA